MVRAGTSTSSHLSSLYISGVSRSIEPRTRSPLEQLLQRSLRRRDRHSNLIFGRNWNDESRGQQGTKELIDQTRGEPLKSAPTAVTTLVLHPPYYRHPPIDDGPPPLCLHVVSPTSLRPHLSSACTRDRVKSRNLSRRWLCAVVAESLPVGPETHRPRKIVRASRGESSSLPVYLSFYETEHSADEPYRPFLAWRRLEPLASGRAGPLPRQHPRHLLGSPIGLSRRASRALPVARRAFDGLLPAWTGSLRIVDASRHVSSIDQTSGVCNG